MEELSSCGSGVDDTAAAEKASWNENGAPAASWTKKQSSCGRGGDDITAAVEPNLLSNYPMGKLDGELSSCGSGRNNTATAVE